MEHPSGFCEDINCERCGGYLAGLVDGEGCFCLLHTETRVRYTPLFQVKLRYDDLEILKNIQSFLRCGNICKIQGKGANPQASFRVLSIPQNAEIIVPFFHRFPLRAKKSKDFVLWREVVLHISQMPLDPCLGRGKGGGGRRWTVQDCEKVCNIQSLLKKGRSYSPMEVLV